jgi:Holliday junction resolvase RusA-like endonuclease
MNHLLTMVELVETKIPSVNHQYKPCMRKNKTLYLYKDPKVEKYQNEFKSNCSLPNISHLEDPVLVVHFTFIFRTRFWQRDVSNMLKATEDALVSVIGIDDSRSLKVSAEKEKTEEKSKEYVRVEIFIS